MPKHRGLILEHQTSRPGSLNDIFMDDAKNSSQFAWCFDRETGATLDGDGRSRVGAWKRAVIESGSGVGRGDFLVKWYHLVSFSLTRRVVVDVPKESALARYLETVSGPGRLPGSSRISTIAW